MNETSVEFLLGFLAVFFLILLNGFFVAVEFAIVRSHPTKFKDNELKGKFGTKSALGMIEELDLSLSATQLGITVASLVLGWFGESIFAHFFEMVFSGLGTGLRQSLSHGLATALALILVTVLHVVIGELAAKSVAIRYPEETLRFLAPPMRVMSYFCRPILFVLNYAANLFLSLFGLKAVTESERVHTSRELSMLVAASTKVGVLDKSEEQMLQGIFHFSETVAREVMTPRTNVVTISIGASFEEVYQTVVSSGLSRFPVYGETVDDMRGILLARDLLRVAPRYFGDRSQAFKVSSILSDAFFVPGTKSIDDLLSELKERKIHIALVLDEHGGFDGVVTLEDIIEEIVGEIFDESDGAKSDIVREESGDVLLDGGVLVTDINQELQIEIPEGDYDTIAGFIFACLGRMAVDRDTIILSETGEISVNNEEFELPSGIDPQDYRFKIGVSDGEGKDIERPIIGHFIVERVVGNRIETIRFHPGPTAPEDQAATDLALVPPTAVVGPAGRESEGSEVLGESLASGEK